MRDTQMASLIFWDSPILRETEKVLGITNFCLKEDIQLELSIFQKTNTNNDLIFNYM